MDDLLLCFAPPLLLCTGLWYSTVVCWWRRRRARGLLPPHAGPGSVQHTVTQLTDRTRGLEDHVAIELARRAELRAQVQAADPVKTAELIVFEEYLRASNPRP
ncbi:hypothetical protein [Streptomyces sp. NPDC018584]|uniref:hypothetical protein n=1 Tax=unclassified Streptomyces TaxID=2593676 RepID=UPI003794D1F7